MNVDYLVATYTATQSSEGEVSKVIDALRVLKANGEDELQNLRKWAGYGFVGWQRAKRVFAMKDDRVYVSATGSAASDRELLEFIAGKKELSVARIDLQITIPEPRGADTRIATIIPNERYNSILIRPTNPDRHGWTLYIGSPSSRIRLRIYNKTAESGIKINGYEAVRYELLLRDQYADKAMQALRTSSLGVHYLNHVRRMVDKMTLKHLEDWIDKWKEQVEPLPDVIFADEESAMARRKRWFESTVIPVLRKMYIEEPDYVVHVLETVYNDTKGIINRTENKEGEE